MRMIHDLRRTDRLGDLEEASRTERPGLEGIVVRSAEVACEERAAGFGAYCDADGRRDAVTPA